MTFISIHKCDMATIVDTWDCSHSFSDAKIASIARLFKTNIKERHRHLCSDDRTNYKAELEYEISQLAAHLLIAHRTFYVDNNNSVKLTVFNMIRYCRDEAIKANLNFETEIYSKIRLFLSSYYIDLNKILNL